MKYESRPWNGKKNTVKIMTINTYLSTLPQKNIDVVAYELEERAAIKEFHGGMTRLDAEISTVAEHREKMRAQKTIQWRL